MQFFTALIFVASCYLLYKSEQRGYLVGMFVFCVSALCAFVTFAANLFK